VSVNLCVTSYVYKLAVLLTRLVNVTNEQLSQTAIRSHMLLTTASKRLLAVGASLCG